MGGNAALGFARSFSAMYFCRNCLSSNKETKYLTVDVTSSHRNEHNYEDALEVIKKSEKFELKHTYGIHSGCVLNELKYFHILNNWNFDIMHDLCEGTIPFLLECLFQYLTSNQVVTETELTDRMMFHDYGTLNRQSRPSKFKIGKKNNNQSASSSKCLMEHIPFILHDYESHDKVKEVWICITSKLKIMKICFSNNLSEVHLLELENLVDIHLKSFIKYFEKPLKPKQHLLTHYATSIRKVGPIMHNSALRFEMKHKELKDTIKHSCNFKNIPMSIVRRMQINNTFHRSYIDSVKHSVMRIIDDNFIQEFGHLLHNFEGFKNIHCMKNLTVNSDFYESGLLLKNDHYFEEIRKILKHKDDFYFMCSRYRCVRFDEFLNSVEITEVEPKQWSFLKHNELEFKKTHNKIKLNNSCYILSTSLELEKNLCF